ncbi:MFS transporter [Roseateles amylovorans]|jgi:MFS transporter, DHA1 family, inner membrane transport protein|uniref:MFS transporter n=1 Tax=Roseateles amylovorans TaxID=2978473 RepID=A0ABY6B2K7_9BURK|nr:MFS transporter [Roseateles amylovorans]UXH77525.1 MFS transporter [Roseateles amylovorans]
MSSSSRMPIQVWILSLSSFAIGTAEFVIAGILSQVADTLGVTPGQAGNLITAYALAVVIGGPVLTLWLARFPKKRVLVGLMAMFIAGNLISAFATDYSMLLVSRVVAGLTQGPFYGIGAVVATRLVSDTQAGQAVGRMFAGLTLANVLGVPAGAWIGNRGDWHTTFLVVALLGGMAMVALSLMLPRDASGTASHGQPMGRQLAAFKNPQLLASLAITTLGWVGFMTFYGYIGPIAEHVAGFDRSSLSGVLVVVGLGLVVGNALGGRTADANLRWSLMGWPVAMIAALLAAGWLAPYKWPFLAAAFVFGITSFANVPSLQMRVMKHGQAAPELAATANISAFNIANALGGVIGGVVIDSSLGEAAIPFAAAIVPAVALLFIVSQEWRRPAADGTARLSI